MEHLVSIVIPTRNEEKNIGRLLQAIAASVTIPYETIVVDDSDNKLTRMAAIYEGATAIQGKHKGLGQAMLDGIAASSGDIVVLMDADLSHSPAAIPNLINPIINHGYDMTIGSRYIKGGETVGWTKKRIVISKVASLLGMAITGIHDATSGFFAFRRSIVENTELKASSWKIMLEILVKANPTAVMEVPISFEDRKAGQSKFNKKEVKNYLVHLFRLALYRYQAVIKFGLIGISGTIINFLLLYALTDLVGMFYIGSAVIATIIASTNNYILNHKWTFSDRTISNHLLGWTKYQLVSSSTDWIYIGMIALFTEVFGIWYILSAALSLVLIFPAKFILASGLIWSKKLDVKSEDYEWNAFFKGSPIQKWWKRSIAKTVWTWAPNASKLLEIGCGSSPTISKYDHAIGIDTNKRKLEFMKKKLPNCKFLEKKTEQFKDEEFDHVLCIEVLEHLNNPTYMISEIARLLKPYGNAIIATPDYKKTLWHLAERFTPYKEEHIVKLDKEKLEEICRLHKLEPVRSKYIAGCDLVEEFVKVV